MIFNKMVKGIKSNKKAKESIYTFTNKKCCDVTRRLNYLLSKRFGNNSYHRDFHDDTKKFLVEMCKNGHAKIIEKILRKFLGDRRFRNKKDLLFYIDICSRSN